MKKDATHRPVLIVIAGPNGSGKTTVTSKVLHHEWMEDALYNVTMGYAKHVYHKIKK